VTDNIQSCQALFKFCSTMIGHSGPVESLAWDPMHRQLVSAGDGWPHVWNFTPDSVLSNHSTCVTLTFY
jgi:WD40 repeat protein